jgi:hypothetical protein
MLSDAVESLSLPELLERVFLLFRREIDLKGDDR